MIVITLAHLVSNANATSGSILIIGDSLSAEYGIQSNTGWVSYIQEYLNEYNKPYKITNVSISGETTSGGLSRLGKALERYSPEIVVIELGSNDALRGLPLDMTKKNLSEMIDMSKGTGAQVMIIGMQLPPNYGKTYVKQFSEIYKLLADEKDVTLVPFLFEGFATNRDYFQEDGIHPNEKAQATMASNVWVKLRPML